MSSLSVGVYEQVLDEELQELLDSHSDLKPILRKIDDEEAPQVYAQFVGKIIGKALHVAKKNQRVDIINRLLELLSATDGLEYVQRHAVLADDKNLLMQVGGSTDALARPKTPLSTSALLTGQGVDPPLEHELRAELLTADRVDILISFIKWSGLRLLIPAFERLAEENIPVRIISTSYMGASDPAALEWLSKQKNISIKVSYDTGGTRLHAKAYHFVRNSGFSTAYIGSANMSHSAMTQGLEWTVKVTVQDMPHILERFVADFSAYWENPEFEPFGKEQDFERFRSAISSYKQRAAGGPQFFAEITPRPFQERILEALAAARQNKSMRNLVVAATGTGKTVVSALDYKQYIQQTGKKERLLFVVHRKEILEQALGCFRTVLRDQNFGELLVDGVEPTGWNHVFASVQSLRSKQPWNRLGKDHFRFVIVDEAHHGTASSYRPLFDHLDPAILLGLTATPERMDGSLISPDFGGHFAAEIRLPEALEEKLLCPFHYFGVSDCIDLDDDRFWKNGRYDQRELENVYTGDDFRAKQRVDLILQAIHKYQPDLDGVRGVGFCAGQEHARYMSRSFNEVGIASAVILGTTGREERAQRTRAFREGELSFIFTVDVWNEGVDVPGINMALFLRPTESLTVFLQQLGRGLRHAPGKDCLTVLDFVGQTHRKYRLDTKFKALLSRDRQRIDREIESDFPNLPAGCSIILERIARERILKKIKDVLNNLNDFIPESIQTWERHSTEPLTFGNFIDETGLSPIAVLKNKTWSEWKAAANNLPAPTDPDLAETRKALTRLALRSDPKLLDAVKDVAENNSVREGEEKYGRSRSTALHYLFWGQKGDKVGVSNGSDSLEKWRRNVTAAQDAAEIAEWRRRNQPYPFVDVKLPFPCDLKVHASYGSHEIKAALGLNSVEKPGPTGVGVFHNKELKVYAHLVTFRKVEQDFSPTTLYKDYPISRKRMHWESQSTATQTTTTGQNYIHFKERGYTILFFGRVEKQIEGEAAPFVYLGPASALISYEGDRPISMVWELEHQMPAALFEEARP
jgi:superfamily II DNA or RNA helicase/HKD family nuclease